MPGADMLELNPEMPAAGSELSEQLYEREIELCVKAGADEARLREDGYNVYQLEQIRQGMEAGLDVSAYLHPQYSWLDMEEIRKGLKQGIDMSRYREAGYSTEQKREIRKGIARHLDVSQYDKKEYLGEQMRQLRFGLMDGVPITFFKNPAYNAAQMEELRLGLKNNIDISAYANPNIPYLKMRAVRRCLEDGMAFSEKEIADYEDSILEQLYKAHRSGVDIRFYVEQGYNALQLEQIRLSLEEGLDFQEFIRKDMRGESLKEIRLGLESRLDVTPFASEKYRWRQMREIRLGLESRLDVSCYLNPCYEYTQMREIRKGLEKGLDVTRYNSMVYTAYDMHRMRLKLERGETVRERPYTPSRIPDVYNDPVVPPSERPDKQALTAALKREKEALKARKEGKTEGTPSADPAEALIPKLPSSEDVPPDLFGGARKPEAQQEREDIQKVDMHGHSIVISDDGLACYLSLPRPKEGVRYTEELLHALLRRSNVVKGVDEVAIKVLLRDEKYDEQVMVARGLKPVNGTDGRYEYHFDRRAFTNPELTEDGTADFSSVRFYSEVRAGDVIATYHKATAGTDGYAVTGEVLPARRGIEKPVLKGRGFLLLDDRVSYAAAVSGVAKTSGNELNINRLMIISDNVVDVNTKIEFAGDIWIKSNLIPGTEVVAQGDVIMETVAESLTIRAGGHIVLKKGATGRTRGHLKAGGSVAGTYFANYDIEAKSGIFANSFLHCNAETEEKLVCFGENGTIYGGRIQARLGIECAVAGTESGVPTVFVLGITTQMIRDYGNAEKLAERTESEIATITGQMEKLNAMPVHTKELMQVKIKLGAVLAIKRKELENQKEQIGQLSDYISSVAGSESLISKTLYSGTTLIVDETEVRITETKEATEMQPITIKGKARQWQRIQRK